MDLFLFDRYGLSINENNLDVINGALEKSRAESKWLKNLKAKNDKILQNAKKEQAKWENDKKILTDSFARAAAAQEITQSIKAVIEYIDKHSADENRFENAVSAFIELNLKASDVEDIYKKYSSVYGTDAYEKKINSYKKLARDLVVSYGAFINVVNNIDDNIKCKFYEAGVDLSDFASALRLDECRDSSNIINNSEAISAVAYDIYNSKLLKDADKNAFMDIFSVNSNSPKSLVKTISSEGFEDFSFAGWATVKNINFVCRFMDSEAISKENVSEIPPQRQSDFIKAMNKLFGIRFEGNVSTDSSGKPFVSNEIPQEIRLGEAELKKSEFDKAKKYFQISVNKNPYCWQGYWGMFKSELRAVSDEDVCMPGFISQLNKKNSGKPVDEIVELYSRAKELAVIQQSKEINFYNIENRFREADRKEKEFEKYKADLAVDYNDMKIQHIHHKDYPSFIQTFTQKAKVYSKNKRLVDDGFVGNVFLLIFGVYALLFGIMGNMAALTGSYSEILAIATVLSGFVAGIAMGIHFYSFWCGFIACAVSFGLDWLITEAIHSSLISSVIMLAGIVCIAYFVFRTLKRHKIKRTFDNDTKELIEYVATNVSNCFWEDLMEYYESNNLNAYGIAVDESALQKLNFSSYLLLMNGATIET